MDVALDLVSYAHALGRAQAAWRFASPEVRRAAALATISAAWDSFRRDAGAGATGPAHESIAPQLLFTDDPRRDAVVLWLADHGAPAISEAAKAIARTVGASRRFEAEDQALLDAAYDAFVDPTPNSGSIRKTIAEMGGSDTTVLETLRALAAVVERLRSDADFLEGEGAEVRHALPRGTLRRYVAAEPAGCWALNLALLTRGGQPAGMPLPPGLVSRVLFRCDLEAAEIAAHLIEGAHLAWTKAYERLERLELELVRGQAALAHFSRNARTRDAWLLVAALCACTRTQLARALSLSRAGADIQANALADAGLAILGSGGKIAWIRARTKEDTTPALLEQAPLGNAVSDLNASLAEIDRLLARTTR